MKEKVFLANGHAEVTVDYNFETNDPIRYYIDVNNPLGDGLLRIGVDENGVSGRRQDHPCSYVHDGGSEEVVFKKPHVTSIHVKTFLLSKYDVLYQVTAKGVDVDILPIGTIDNIDDPDKLNEVFELWRKFSATFDLR